MRLIKCLSHVRINVDMISLARYDIYCDVCGTYYAIVAIVNGNAILIAEIENESDAVHFLNHLSIWLTLNKDDKDIIAEFPNSGYEEFNTIDELPENDRKKLFPAKSPTDA